MRMNKSWYFYFYSALRYVCIVQLTDIYDRLKSDGETVKRMVGNVTRHTIALPKVAREKDRIKIEKRKFPFNMNFSFIFVLLSSDLMQTKVNVMS